MQRLPEKHYFLIFLIINLTLSSIYIYNFSTTYAYPSKIILGHVLVIFIIHLILYLLLSIVSLLSMQSIKKIGVLLIGSFVAFYYFFIIFLYLIDWIANESWGSNISWNLMAEFPKHFDSMLKVFEISKNLVLFLIAILLGLIIALGVLITRHVLLKYVKHKSQIDRKESYRFIAYNILITLMLSFYVWQTHETKINLMWKGEPILHLVANTLFADTPRIKLEISKDKDIRELFQSNLPDDYKRKNVILFIADALRADHMGVYGYHRQTTPYLSQLDQQNQLQKSSMATSSCSESACGILSILSSRRYDYIGPGIYKMSDLFKDLNWNVHYILSSDHALNHLEQRYSDQLDTYIDGSDYVTKEITAYSDQGVLKELDKVESFDGTPSFFYFHLMSTHLLGPDEKEFEIFPTISLPKRIALDKKSSYKLEMETNAYDNGIIQFDAYVKRLLTKLDSKGYLENSLVIITSDHGEGLGERHNYSHTYFLYQEDLNIPIMFYTPENDLVLQNTSYSTQIDIAPTTLDYLNIPIPKTWQGISLLMPNHKERYTFHQTLRGKQELSVIFSKESELLKLLVTRINGKISNYRFFDLNSDFKEKTNIIDSINKVRLKKMKTQLFSEFKLEDQ